jgi:hypothetical protein
MSSGDLAAWANAAATFLAVAAALGVALSGWNLDRRRRDRETYSEHVRVFGHATLFAQRAVENLAQAHDVLMRDDVRSIKEIQVELADMLHWAPAGERLVLLSPAAFQAHIDTRAYAAMAHYAITCHPFTTFGPLVDEIGILQPKAQAALDKILAEAAKLRAP